LGGRRRSYAAPLPFFETGVNFMIHEYCLVQQETGNHRFPEVRRLEYVVRNLATLGMSLAYRLPGSMQRVVSSLRTRARKILKLEWPRIDSNERSPGFESVEDAIDYAIRVPSNDNVCPPHLELLRGIAR
jgi:hypothetical protein